MAVRREKVVLELVDRFSSELGRPAAATKAFEKTLADLDRTSVRTERSQTKVSTSVDKTGRSASTAGREIDRFSGRLRLLADVAAILGPALVPIGAIAIPAVAGLAAQFGAAAIAGGTALIAFQGFGDALEAVNDAALEPTAENLEKARIAMQNLSPEARSLVREIQDMRPAFQALRDAAASGLSPGLERALFRIEDRFPQLERVLFGVADAAGDVAEEFAAGIAGPRGRQFLRFVRNEVPGALRDLGEIVGNLAGGLAELWQAFTPLNRGFSDWLVDASQGFDEWAQGLAQTQGFEDFVDYIRTTGPKVADALASIANAVLQIVEAAAPLGGPVLEALGSVADVIASIADSDAGPAIMATVTALSLLNRSMATFGKVSRSAWGRDARGMNGAIAQFSALRSGAARLAGPLAGLGVAMSGLGDDFAFANASMGALMGSMAGPWGAAVGGGIGLLLDFAGANDKAAADAEALAATLDKQTGALTQNSEEWARNELISSGAAAAAQRLGLDLADVQDAFLGNEAAAARVANEIERLQALSDVGGGDSNGILGGVNLGEMAKDAITVGNAIGRGNDAVKAGTEDWQLHAAMAGKAGDAGEGAGRRTAEGMGRAKSAAQEFREELTRINELLQDRASLRGYEAALDDFVDALPGKKKLEKIIGPNGRINIDLPKGREVQEQLDAIAQSAFEVAERMKRSQRIEFLNRARQDMIDAAQKLGLTKEQARGVADFLGLLHRKRAEPEIRLDPGSTEAKMAQIDAQLRALDGNSATVTVHYQTTGRAVAPNGEFRPGLADGGTVPGPRPRPYRDNMLFSSPISPLALAGGEEVITNRNGEADRFRADRAAGRIPAYADGGTVAAMNRAPAMGASGGGTRVIVREREVLPRTIVLDAGELGRLVIDTTHGVVGAYRDFDAGEAAKSYRYGGSGE